MNTFQIKLLAVILMVIDHIGFFIFKDVVILRIIGRLSFPLFAFLIANGYLYTRDVKKYFLRLFIFANIIQIPSLFMYIPINIFYTLSFGLLCIIVYESQKDVTLKVVGILIILGITNIIGPDYGIYGVLVILIIHVFRGKYLHISFGILLTGLLYYGIDHIQHFAALTPFIMKLYNKEKGPKMKYFFYLFYPVHLVFLDWLSQKIG